MTEFLKQLITQHFVLLFVSAVVVLLVCLAIAVYLFRELRKNPDATFRALMLELSVFRKVRRLFSKTPEPVSAQDDLGMTMTPFKAVADQRISGEKKP